MRGRTQGFFRHLIYTSGNLRLAILSLMLVIWSGFDELNIKSLQKYLHLVQVVDFPTYEKLPIRLNITFFHNPWLHLEASDTCQFTGFHNSDVDSVWKHIEVCIYVRTFVELLHPLVWAAAHTLPLGGGVDAGRRQRYINIFLPRIITYYHCPFWPEQSGRPNELGHRQH